MVKKEAIPADAGALSGGKSKLKLALLIVVGLPLAIGLSIGGTWFFLSESLRAEKTEGAASEAAEPGKQPTFYGILAPAFVINFNQNSWQRCMQVGVTSMGRSKAQMGALREHILLIRSKLVMLLSSQGFDSLVIPIGKEILRQQATTGLQEPVKKEVGRLAIEQVLFINFVPQQVSHGRARSASPG